GTSFATRHRKPRAMRGVFFWAASRAPGRWGKLPWSWRDHSTASVERGPMPAGRNPRYLRGLAPWHVTSQPPTGRSRACAWRGPRLRPDELRPASFNRAPNCYFRDRESGALTSAQLGITCELDRGREVLLLAKLRDLYPCGNRGGYGANAVDAAAWLP